MNITFGTRDEDDEFVLVTKSLDSVVECFLTGFDPSLEDNPTPKFLGCLVEILAENGVLNLNDLRTLLRNSSITNPSDDEDP